MRKGNKLQANRQTKDSKENSGDRPPHDKHNKHNKHNKEQKNDLFDQAVRCSLQSKEAKNKVWLIYLMQFQNC